MIKHADYMNFRRKLGIFALGLLLLVVSASLVLGAPAEPAADPLQLRGEIIVDSHQITLGDLFLNADDMADKIVATAPEPGRRLALHPATIIRAALANGRQWYNSDNVQRVLVQRPGRRLGALELSNLLTRKLTEDGDGMDYELAISGGAAGLFVPQTAMSDPYVEHIELNPANGSFTAQIVPYDGAKPVTLRGRAWQLTQIPALNRRVSSGEIINANDIHWISIRANRLGTSLLREEDQLVGKAARRSLGAAKALRKHDVKTPDTVKKGELVTISYNVPGLRLTSRAKVLVNAGTGDTVRAVNVSSNRTIEITITGPGQAVAASTQTFGG